MKTILVIDNNPWTQEGIAFLLDKLEGYRVETASHHEEGLRLYEKGKFDVVIIDFSMEGGESLLHEIFAVDTRQRIITLSDTPSCSESLGCAHCIAHYRKRRLLKPYKINEVIQTIKNFDSTPCEYAKKFTS